MRWQSDKGWGKEAAVRRTLSDTQVSELKGEAQMEVRLPRKVAPGPLGWTKGCHRKQWEMKSVTCKGREILWRAWILIFGFRLWSHWNCHKIGESMQIWLRKSMSQKWIGYPGARWPGLLCSGRGAVGTDRKLRSHRVVMVNFMCQLARPVPF